MESRLTVHIPHSTTLMKASKINCKGRLCKHKGWTCGVIKKFKRYSYACTREEGHKGPHVACGSDEHNYAIWSDKKLT